jgi:hypothetical protein
LPRRPRDIPAAEFRRRLAADGFTFLPLSGEFIDTHHRGAARIAAVKRGRTIDRRTTLAALHHARAVEQARLAAVDGARAERERIAATIAPQVLSPCRADLEGPAAIAQLADDFLSGCTTQEGISFKSLISKGWRAAQLRTYADEARAVADRRQIATCEIMPLPRQALPKRRWVIWFYPADQYADHERLVTHRTSLHWFGSGDFRPVGDCESPAGRLAF